MPHRSAEDQTKETKNRHWNPSLKLCSSISMSRPPNYEFQEWWNKQRERENHTDHPTSSSSSSDNNYTFLTVDIRSPDSSLSSSIDSPFGKERQRSRSARQLSFFYLLKLQHLLHSLSSLFLGFLNLFRTANRRIALNSSSPLLPSESRFYRIIKVLLVIVLILLCFELVAYFKGWHFSPPSLHKAEVLGFVELVYASWLRVRAEYLAPPLQSLSNVCIVLFLVQSVDRALLMLGCIWIKLRGIKPVAVMEYSSNTSVADYPMVLVQIPMCNEREVRCRSQIPCLLILFWFSFICAL